jgi:hypothetical protein
LSARPVVGTPVSGSVDAQHQLSNPITCFSSRMVSCRNEAESRRVPANRVSRSRQRVIAQFEVTCPFSLVWQAGEIPPAWDSPALRCLTGWEAKTLADANQREPGQHCTAPIGSL